MELNSKTSNNSARLAIATLAINISKLVTTTLALGIAGLAAAALIVAIAAALSKLAYASAYKGNKGSVASNTT